MTRHAEPGGEEPIEAFHAAFEVEDAVALLAPKVVVMMAGDMSSLVSRGLTGKSHR